MPKDLDDYELHKCAYAYTILDGGYKIAPDREDWVGARRELSLDTCDVDGVHKIWIQSAEFYNSLEKLVACAIKYVKAGRNPKRIQQTT